MAFRVLAARGVFLRARTRRLQRPGTCVHGAQGAVGGSMVSAPDCGSWAGAAQGLDLLPADSQNGATASARISVMRRAEMTRRPPPRKTRSRKRRRLHAEPVARAVARAQRASLGRPAWRSAGAPRCRRRHQQRAPPSFGFLPRRWVFGRFSVRGQGWRQHVHQAAHNRHATGA